MLLHEIGHVRDFENETHFDRDSKTTDLIEGETYALDECIRRPYSLNGDMYFDALANYKEASNYWGQVVRRVVARFQRPSFRQWGQ